MIKSFSEFIGENMDPKSDFIKSLTANLIERIRNSSKDESEDYMEFSGMEFTEPFTFDLLLNVRRDSNPTLEDDSHFNKIPWEKLNYDDYGYAIDANAKMSKLKHHIPKIIIHLILDPKKEPLSYGKLYHRLLDLVTHETNHLNQVGLNREPFNTNVSDKADRNASKKSYRYFLLIDEIESMVEGMYVRSNSQQIPLDQVFDEYLQPFIETGYITSAEYRLVMNAWVKRALALYPDANFSSKVSNIINSN